MPDESRAVDEVRRNGTRILERRAHECQRGAFRDPETQGCPAR